MFPVKTYVSRRAELRAKTGGGLILLPGNQPSANNYPNNAYYFRQDSTFLYYFGLDRPSLAGVIDADTGEEVLFGDDFTVDDIIWTGPQPTLRELGAEVGVTATFPMAELEKRLRKAVSLGRKIHYLPPYRGETKLQLSALLGIKPELLHDYKSVELMFAVAEMREKKSAEEVEAMERAFLIGYQMHTLAMHMCHPGVIEREIAGAIEGIAKSSGSGLSFPSIVSQHGETLHNLNADGFPYVSFKPGTVDQIRQVVRIAKAVAPTKVLIEVEGGSAGGHNGIKSIDRSLGTPKYARVRMGVGHSKRGANAHDNTVNWVLGGFGPDQRKQLPEFLADGADAAEDIIFHGLAKTQEKFNGR